MNPDPRLQAFMEAPTAQPQDMMQAPDGAIEPEKIPELPRDPSFEQDPIDREDGSDKEQLGKDLQDEFNVYKQNRTASGIERQWREAELIYFAIPYYPIPYGTSYYQLREVYRQVQDKQSLWTQRFFTDRMFGLRARKSENAQMAEVAASHIRWQIENFGNMEELDMWGSQKFIYGTSLLRYGWRNYKQTQYKKTFIKPQNSFEKVWKTKPEEFVTGAPFLKYYDLKRVYTDIECDKIQDSPVVWLEEEVSDEYIWTQVREGLFDKGQVMKALEIPGDPREFDERNTDWRSRHLFPRRDNRKTLRILVMGWTNGGRAYSFIDGKVPTVVQANRNVYGLAPFLALRNAAKPGFFYGEGEPNILAAQDRMLKDTISVAMESAQFENRPTFITTANTKKQFERMKFLPGEVISVASKEQMDEVRALDLNSQKTQRGIELAMSFIIPQMQSTRGARNAADVAASHRTAGGVKEVMAAESSILEHDIRISMPVVRQLYSILYQMNGRWENGEVAQKIDGPDGKLITDRPSLFGTEVFSPQVDVEIQLANTLEPPEVLRQNAMMALQVCAPFASMINMEPLITQLARAFGETRPQRWLKDPSKSKADALDENDNIKALGTVWEVQPTDDHMYHLRAHQMFMQTADYLQLSPVAQGNMLKHIQQHQYYAEQQQQAMMQMSQQGPASGLGGSGGAAGPGNSMAGPGSAMAGAGQQGMMPGAMPV